MSLAMPQHRTRTDLRTWLYRLDSYTNAEHGHARSLLAVQDVCVGCGGRAVNPDVSGFCPRCSAKRRPDQTEVILFRPLRRNDADTHF
jgi:hypothetical protein